MSDMPVPDLGDVASYVDGQQAQARAADAAALHSIEMGGLIYLAIRWWQTGGGRRSNGSGAPDDRRP